MFKKEDKNNLRVIRHARVRKKISGTSDCPRLDVYRSNASIYAQIIDDSKGVTLLAVSSRDKDLESKLKGKTKTEQARIVGETIGEKALSAKIKNVVFDRGGYIYTGRVQALAEGARSAGLEF